MPLHPINYSTAFRRWPHFSPGKWIDFNPSVVFLSDGRRVALIRRDEVPPIPGEGSIWIVEINSDNVPIKEPVQLISRGEDPRGIVIDDRLFVFFVTIDKDSNGRAIGSQMHIAEFRSRGLSFELVDSFMLPKNPTGAAHLIDTRWEKNWVPFYIGQNQIALIYSHDPWVVLILQVSERGTGQTPHLVSAYTQSGIRWAFGEIRGGTPPLPYDDQHLITFFHSSQVIGSRNVYMVGACVFSRLAPFLPTQITVDPLLVAPYHSTVERFGWPVLASVIFPLGAIQELDGYTLLCGLDDGEIGTINIPRKTISDRLIRPSIEPHYHILNEQGSALASNIAFPSYLSDRPFDLTNALRVARFLAQMVDTQSDYVEFGSENAITAITVSPHTRHSYLLASPNAPLLKRNIGLNGIENATVLEGTENPNVTKSIALLRLCNTQDNNISPEVSNIIATHKPIVIIESATTPSIHQTLQNVLKIHSYKQKNIFPLTPNIYIYATAQAIAAKSLWLGVDWSALQ